MISRSFMLVPESLQIPKPIAAAFFGACLSLVAGGVIALEPRAFVPVAGLLLAGLAIAALQRWQMSPLFILLAGNAIGATIWLRPVPEEAGRREELQVYGLMVGLALALSLLICLSRINSTRIASYRLTILDALVPTAILLAIFMGL